MSVSLSNEVRIAAAMPIYCSACFNQDPSLRHIDFDAACDRGYGEDRNPDTPKIAMDDLVICENCVRNAAELIEMEKTAKREREIDDLHVRLDRSERERKQAQNYSATLEDAFDKRAQPIEVDHRKKPRQVKGEPYGTSDSV